MYTFYEFFAGGGMAREGLGDAWRCLFANDIDKKKAAAYQVNWGVEHFLTGDIRNITTAQLPGKADLAWASFPCQDLSLAGNGAGLNGDRSGTFWPFWKLMQALSDEGRAPAIIVLENVYGALRSHGGRDFSAIASALADGGYRFGAIILDAIHFVPQSRPRLFIIGVRNGVDIPEGVSGEGPVAHWHPQAVLDAVSLLSKRASSQWLWWNPGEPPERTIEFSDIIEEEPEGVEWNDRETTRRLLDMMTEVNRNKVREAQESGRRMVGGVYKRTRSGVQRAEVRFDVSGCLRTPAGGSSRQTILVVEGESIRSRLLSPREAARLMGLPDSYQLPARYNDAYHLAGDGLVAPAVSFLSRQILEPVLNAARRREREAA